MFGCLAACLLAGPVRLDADDVPLPAEAVCRIGSARWRSVGHLETLLPTPDGRVVVGYDQGYLIGWDAVTGCPLYRTAVPGLGRHTLVLEPGRPAVRLETQSREPGGSDGPLAVVRFDPRTGRPLGPPEWHKVRGTAHLGPAGRVLVEAFEDTVRRYGLDETDYVLAVRRLDPPGPVRELARGEHPIRAAVGPNDRFVVVADGQRVRMLDTASGRVLRELPTDGRPVWSLAVTPDATAAVGQLDAGRGVGALVRWDLATGRLRPLTEFDLPDPRSVPGRLPPWFSPCGRFLFAGERVADPDRNGVRVVLRDATTGRALFSPGDDEKLLAVSTDGGTAYTTAGTMARDRIPRTPLHAQLVSRPRDPDDVTVLGFDSGGVVAEERRGERFRSVRYDARTGRRLGAGGWFEKTDGEWHPWYWTTHAPDGRRRIEVRQDRDNRITGVRVVDAVTGTPCPLPDAPVGHAAALEFVAGGRQVAYVAVGRVRVWDAIDGRLIRKCELPDFRDTRHAAVSADGRRVAGLTYLGDDPRVWEVRVWELAALGPPRVIRPPHPYDLPRPVWSADGRYLAVAVRRRTAEGAAFGVCTLDLSDIRPPVVHETDGGHYGVHGFSPDGRSLACSRFGPSAVELIETATGSVRHRFHGHCGLIDGVAFSPDGRHLAAASPDAPIFVWDVRGELTKPSSLSPAELDAAVRELASADAAVAFRAVRRLAQFPTESLPKLRAALPPVPAGRVKKLLADLDAPRFADRQAAGRELSRLGRAVESELRAAVADGASAEVRRRAGDLLAKLADGKPTADELRAVRAVEAVEWMGTPEARALLTAWAGGGSHARLTAEATAAIGRGR